MCELFSEKSKVLGSPKVTRSPNVTGPNVSVGTEKALYCLSPRPCWLVRVQYSVLCEVAWFIDVSQAVEPIHPSGLDFLLRDRPDVSGGPEAEIVCQIRNYQKSQAAMAWPVPRPDLAPKTPGTNCSKSPKTEIMGPTEGSHFIL